MGVKNLWEILECCKKTLPLHHLQNKRLCIDLSCWIVQLQNACKSHSSIKDKVYLRSLFHRLRALLALDCTLILVTDGSIPAIKLSTYRRRLGSGNEVNRDGSDLNKLSLPRNMGSDFSLMIKEAKILGMALGIPCLDGIEEGEAQCALLNSESLCDGCFSADSDVFLFGAKTVYRDIDLGDGGHVVCYEMVDIQRKLGFGKNSLIALALLLGSDYSHGVYGFGRETACQIVKSFGDHGVLQRIALEGLAFGKNTKGLKKQKEFLNCDANNENSLVYKHKNSVNEQDSQKVDQFIKVINAYSNPKCHLPDSEAVHRVLGHYPFQRSELQKLCHQFFDWTSEKTDEYILPKIAERDLRRFCKLRSSTSELGVEISLHEIPAPCPISSIIKRRKAQGKECFEVSWREFNDFKSSIVPADLIECACPEKIVEFEEKMQAKKRIRKPRSKKQDKTADMDEIDLKLRSLMLDIESENNGASSSALLQAASLPTKKICKPRSKKQEKTAATDEVDRKFQGIMLDIESGKDGVYSSTYCQAATLKKKGVPEIIDILSPSPPIPVCKSSKFHINLDQQIDLIHLSDSETDKSPEHARKARELRLFLASVKTGMP